MAFESNNEEAWARQKKLENDALELALSEQKLKAANDINAHSKVYVDAHDASFKAMQKATEVARLLTAYTNDATSAIINKRPEQEQQQKIQLKEIAEQSHKDALEAS